VNFETTWGRIATRLSPVRVSAGTKTLTHGSLGARGRPLRLSLRSGDWRTARCPAGYARSVMFSMFVLWIVVFAGIFRKARWTIPVAVATMLWSLVLLKLHMTDPIPLNF
jgi:hypothetical protein